jgi:transposase-like protein
MDNMHGKIIDIAGWKFGRWTALRHVGGGIWLCRCDCGTNKLVGGRKLRQGGSKSCGCAASDFRFKTIRQRYTPKQIRSMSQRGTIVHRASALRMIKQGKSVTDVARHFGVSRGRIYAIKHEHESRKERAGGLFSGLKPEISSMLDRAGIESREQLSCLVASGDILKVRKIGKKSAAEIELWLKKGGN